MTISLGTRAAKRKKHVVLITHSRFWSVGAGLWARTLQTVLHLQKHAHLTVVFCDDVGAEDREKIRAMGVRGVVLGNRTPSEHRRMLCELLATRFTRDPPDAFLVDKTENAYFFPVLPRAALKLVDTHDLISARTQRARSFNAPEWHPLTEEQEAELLDRFDRVICIQDEERKQVARWLGEKKTLLAPHPVRATPIAIGKDVTRIGLIASNWHANADGLRNFIDNVWPRVRRPRLALHVYGGIAASFSDNHERDIHFHGVVREIEECYENLDIAINPVRFGAGLKIKTIESLAHGVPLVTTPHGASGLESLSNRALYMADTAEDFSSALCRLIDNESIRKDFNRVGSAHVREHLNPERCFHGVVDAINAHRRRGDTGFALRFPALSLLSNGFRAAASVWRSHRAP